MLQRCSVVFVICIISPVPRCSKAFDNNSTTSVFFNEASATDALESKKSPAGTTSLFPITKFNEPTPVYMKNLAKHISSVTNDVVNTLGTKPPKKSD